MQVVESWWNGAWGSMARERVRLREDKGRWSVEHVGPGDRYEYIPCNDERQARVELQRLTAFGRGWREVGAV